eukprot:gene2278-4428_t
MKNRIASRVFSFFGTVVSGFAIFLIHSWIRNRKKIARDKLSGSDCVGDELHKSRYAGGENVAHLGSCHCQRVQFRVYASSTLKAVDIRSKIRFPRFTIPFNCFESISDHTFLSLYDVRHGTQIGVYSFCNICGTHIAYVPKRHPDEIQINLNCINTNTIKHYSVTYHDSEYSDNISEYPNWSCNGCNDIATPNTHTISNVHTQLQSPNLKFYTTGLLCTDVTSSNHSDSSDRIGPYAASTSTSTLQGPLCLDNTLLATWASLTTEDTPYELQHQHQHEYFSSKENLPNTLTNNNINTNTNNSNSSNSFYSTPNAIKSHSSADNNTTADQFPFDSLSLISISPMDKNNTTSSNSNSNNYNNYNNNYNISNINNNDNKDNNHNNSDDYNNIPMVTPLSSSLSLSLPLPLSIKNTASRSTSNGGNYSGSSKNNTNNTDNNTTTCNSASSNSTSSNSTSSSSSSGGEVSHEKLKKHLQHHLQPTDPSISVTSTSP